MIKSKHFFGGSFIFEPSVYLDRRGFFFESFNIKNYLKISAKYDFVQDNFSKSNKNVLRGLHFQNKNPQGKLVFATKGKIYDVIVDLRNKSRTFGKWKSIIISDKNKLQIWVPPGFAHGFLALTKEVNLVYKCTSFYNPKYEQTLIWNDKTLNINWPVKKPILSKKDREGSTFEHIITKLK